MTDSFNVAWGAKVDDAFIASVIWIVEDLAIGESVEEGTSDLMTCMAWESRRSFDPGKLNLAGSGAIGLIQFMPSTASALGTTSAALAVMTPVQQLNYVWKYFKDYKGKLKTLADLYMAILWPKAVGQPSSYVLWDKATMPTTFRQNAGLDANSDGAVTKAECAAKLTAMLAEGFQPSNARVYTPPSTTPAPVEQTTPTGDSTMDLKDTLVNAAVQVAETAIEGAASHVTGTPTTTPEPEPAAPPTVAQTIDKHVGGKIGTLAGIGVIIATIMANPDFTKALSGFILSLSRGEGGWGALATFAGAALIAWKASEAS